jgi:hypothetical protein
MFSMREFVAVNDSSVMSDISILKREALMFDRIAFPFFKISKNRRDYLELCRSLELLVEHGIAFVPKIELAESMSEDFFNEGKLLMEQVFEMTKTLGIDIEEYRTKDSVDLPLFNDIGEWPIEVITHIKIIAAHGTRLYSISLRDEYNVDACPVMSIELPSKSEKANKPDVMRLVFNAFPVPDEQTKWEQILEYRNDPDSRQKFLDLRHWMSEVTRAKLTPAEVEEKLEYLISKYKRHMELHRIKANTGTLETIVTISAEILGDLVSFKWGKAAQALFSLKKRQVALLEGELTAPGSEIAYIVKANETFL